MKMKNLQVNYALIAFLAYCVKMLAFTPSFADSIIVAVLAGLYGYTQYLKRFQPYNLDEEVKKDIAEVKTALSTIKMAQTTEKMKQGKYF